MVIISSQSFFYGFPSGVGQWWSMAAGNYWRIVSCASWGSGGAWRQETIGEKFPVRHGTLAEHSGRKLVAKGFLSGMKQWRSIVTGNCLRIVSCPTWDHWWSMAAGNYWRIVSHPAWGSGGTWRQETTRPEISRLRFAALEMTGQRGAVAEHDGRKLVATGFLCRTSAGGRGLRLFVI